MSLLVRDWAGAVRSLPSPPPSTSSCLRCDLPAYIATFLKVPVNLCQLSLEGKPLPCIHHHRCQQRPHYPDSLQPCEGKGSLNPYSFPNLGVVDINLKLLGGGGDGGSILDRRDCVPHIKDPKSKAIAYTSNQLAKQYWTTCKKSKEPLKCPVVACELGFMYNKEVIVSALLHKSDPEEYTEEIRHIHKLAHITELKLTKNPAKGDVNYGLPVEELLDQWACPILADVTTNGVTKFVFLRQCGHVLSEQAVKQMCGKVRTSDGSGGGGGGGGGVTATQSRHCLVCGQPCVTREDYEASVVALTLSKDSPSSGSSGRLCENIILPLLPQTAEELERARAFMVKRRQFLRSNPTIPTTTSCTTSTKSPPPCATASSESKRRKVTTTTTTCSSSSSSSSSRRRDHDIGNLVTAGVRIPTHASRESAPEGATPAVWKSLFQDKSKPASAAGSATGEWMTRGSSLGLSGVPQQQQKKDTSGADGRT